MICVSVEVELLKYIVSTSQGLTEPDYGSDASALKTAATKVLALKFILFYFFSVGHNTSLHLHMQTYLKLMP